MTRLLYGSGLRLMECHHLRIKDIDFSSKQIIVRDGKGFKDRVTILPESIIPDLKQHLIKVKVLHEHFLKRGYGEIELPYVLERKYRMQNMNGAGSMYFLQKMFLLVPEQEPEEDIIFMRVYYNGQLKKQ